MDKNVEKTYTDEKTGKFKPNNPGGGRPIGQRNYATIYKEALTKLAELNDKSPEELENEILSSGLLAARKGNYQFYKDILDRIHGQPVKNVKLEGELTSKIISIDE